MFCSKLHNHIITVSKVAGREAVFWGKVQKFTEVSVWGADHHGDFFFKPVTALQRQTTLGELKLKKNVMMMLGGQTGGQTGG